MKVPNGAISESPAGVSLSRLQNEGSQIIVAGLQALGKSIKATE